MSVENWQGWMALLPCDRCNWMPGHGCTCELNLPLLPKPRTRKARALRVATDAERRERFTPLLDVIAAAASERTQGRGAA